MGLHDKFYRSLNEILLMRGRKKLRIRQSPVDFSPFSGENHGEGLFLIGVT